MFLQEAVLKGTQRRFPEIALPDFAHISMETNITTLFEMGLAVRTRAIRALEACSNNLEQAITLLLAAGDMPFHPSWRQSYHE